MMKKFIIIGIIVLILLILVSVPSASAQINASEIDALVYDSCNADDLPTTIALAFLGFLLFMFLLISMIWVRIPFFTIVLALGFGMLSLYFMTCNYMIGIVIAFFSAGVIIVQIAKL